MRNVRKLGLVKYFLDVIEYNRLNNPALPYDPNHPNLKQWTEHEIYRAKVLALSDYFKTLIKQNPLHSETGTKFNSKRLLQMGWTEKEIAVAKENVQPSIGRALLLLTIAVVVLLLAVKYINKLTGHG